MIYWTAKNNSSFLNVRRSAKTPLSAVRSARTYVANEMYGAGVIHYFNGSDEVPYRTDTKNIFTGHVWSVEKHF